MRSNIVFSSSCYSKLQEGLCIDPFFESGKVERSYFPDGESYQRVLSSLNGQDITLIGSTIPGYFMEFYDLACGLVYQGAHSLTMVIPYFAYSTMERVVNKGEIATAKMRAKIISSIPQATVNNKLFLFDLHSEGVAHYFEGSLRPKHLSLNPIIIDAIKSLNLNNFVLASTDAGRAKWVQSLANTLEVEPAFLIKKRNGPNDVKIVTPSSQINKRCVVIYDDMIRSGNSLIEAAKVYKNAGAKEIFALTSHGIFCDGALEKCEKSGLFSKIISTDTYPGLENKKYDCLDILQIEPLLADALKEVN